MGRSTDLGEALLAGDPFCSVGPAVTSEVQHFTEYPNLGGLMEPIQEALMKWGEAMQLRMENRTMHYSPVLGHWRVKKWSGKDARSFLYDGEDFQLAFQALLGSHAAPDTENRH